MANYTTHVPDRITALHERLLLAGMRGEDPHATARYGANEPLTHVTLPPSRATRGPGRVLRVLTEKGLHIDVEKRQARPGLFKLQNPQLGLEVPMLKSASTLLKWAFNCTHNGMWKAVPQPLRRPQLHGGARRPRPRRALRLRRRGGDVAAAAQPLPRGAVQRGARHVPGRSDARQGVADCDVAALRGPQLGTPTAPKRLDESRQRRADEARARRGDGHDVQSAVLRVGAPDLADGADGPGRPRGAHPVRFFAIESIGGDLDRLLRSG